MPTTRAQKSHMDDTNSRKEGRCSLGPSGPASLQETRPVLRQDFIKHRPDTPRPGRHAGTLEHHSALSLYSITHQAP
ncbi:unnamed protein product [Lota lota]